MKQKVKVKSLSCVWLFETLWTVAHQAPPSMGFSGQEYWSGVPLPSPKLSTQGDNTQPCTPLSPEPISCSIQSSNCCFLTHIQVSQGTGKMVWYSHLFKSFPQFVMIHSQRLQHSRWNRGRCFSGIPLVFLWSNKCWQFDLWFFCLFENQLGHLEVLGSCNAET